MPERGPVARPQFFQAGWPLLMAGTSIRHAPCAQIDAVGGNPHTGGSRRMMPEQYTIASTEGVQPGRREEVHHRIVEVHRKTVPTQGVGPEGAAIAGAESRNGGSDVQITWSRAIEGVAEIKYPVVDQQPM